MDLKQSGKRFVGRCPIHEGESPFGFNLYPEGHTARGWWICRSEHCEEHFVRSIIGLTRGVISSYDYGWRVPGDRKATHTQAVNFVLKFLGYNDISEVEVDHEQAAMRRFNAQVEKMTRRPLTEINALCDREKFRSRVVIPSEYYVNRGYSPEILDKFDIGLCTDRRSPMSGRVVVPFYDEDHSMVVGVIGRTIAPQCKRCHTFHESSSPCPHQHESMIGFCKWRTSKNFNDKHALYNYWNANGHIFSSRCVVLVEGAGDVWRLEEAGLHNAVAILGSGIHDTQQIMLESSGADHFIVLTDDDDAGNKAEAAVRRACESYGRVWRLKPTAHDVGDMSVSDVRNHIMPFVYSKMKKVGDAKGHL